MNAIRKPELTARDGEPIGILVCGNSRLCEFQNELR